MILEKIRTFHIPMEVMSFEIKAKFAGECYL
jgi:hypothetical protein